MTMCMRRNAIPGFKFNSNISRQRSYAFSLRDAPEFCFNIPPS
jgi:hypothetical protein